MFLRLFPLTIFFYLISLNLYSQSDSVVKKDLGRVYGGFESNVQWYLNDKGRGIMQPEDPVRSNNYLLVNYQLKSWTAGIQVEGYEKNALLNYYPEFEGTNVATYFLNYKNAKLDITAGYFYEQFGSGMLLRAWEDRALGINTALRGGRVIYKPTDAIRLTALFGQQRTGFDVSNGRIYGFDSDFYLTELLKLKKSDVSFGMSYVGRYEDISSTIQNPNFDALTHGIAARLNYSIGSFYSTLEYNYKSEDAVLNRISNTLDQNLIKDGSAYILNFGYSKKGLGIDATLRRTENMSFLSERVPTVIGDETSLNFNDKVLNFTPALTKQHHSNLANIYVYQAQAGIDFKDPSILKAGETGGQIDIIYEFEKNTPVGGKYGTKVALNFASWYNLPGQFRLTPVDYETNFLGIGTQYFSDYNLELKKQLSETWRTAFYYIKQYYNKPWVEDGSSDVNTNILIGEAVYNFASNKSIRFEAEHMWADADFKNWVGGTVEVNLNDKYSFYVWDIINYGNDDVSNRKHYYNFGGAYRINATRLSMNYGRQRGGLVCVGGVCRFVPESTGFTISLNTAF